MYIIFKVITPSKLSKEQKSLFESLLNTDMNDTEINKFDNFVKRG